MKGLSLVLALAAAVAFVPAAAGVHRSDQDLTAIDSSPPDVTSVSACSMGPAFQVENVASIGDSVSLDRVALAEEVPAFAPLLVRELDAEPSQPQRPPNRTGSHDAKQPAYSQLHRDEVERVCWGSGGRRHQHTRCWLV